MARVKICTEKIRAVDLRVLCATVLQSAEAFYKDPENLRRFEEWQREKAEKAKTPDGCAEQ
jgi:hypothetical protein